MKKLFIAAFVVLLAAMMFWLVGCSKEDSTSSGLTGELSKLTPKSETPNGGPPPKAPQQDCNGTTLTETVTASAFNYYDWSCTNAITSPNSCFNRGDCQDITATVTVTKGGQHTGVNGTICVTNGGSYATINLKVGAILELNNVATGCSALGLESQHPVLAAGETFCYTYTINCALTAGGSYRVNTDGYVTIENHAGWMPCSPSGQCPGPDPCAVGPNEKASFTGIGPTNNCIDVSDLVGTPVNSLNASDATSFTTSITSPNPVNVCASGDVNFTVHICANTSMPYDETWTLDNTATVDGHDCGGNVVLTSCQPPPTGCTFTQGYWKTHGCVGPNGKSQYGHNADRISPILSAGSITMGAMEVSTCQEAGSVFQGAQGSNGIMKLYSQMLAALLNSSAANVPNSSDASCISQSIADANALLLLVDPNGDGTGWANISGANRSAVSALAGTFGQYNEGLLCAQHCQ